MSIHCFSGEEELSKWIVNNELLVAFDFEDPTAISNRTKEVQYYVRPNMNQFSITNWDPCVNTFRQQPSTTPATFLSIFTPLQQFMDSLIFAEKSKIASSLTFTYKQFPNHDYSMDTRLTVHQMVDDYPIGIEWCIPHLHHFGHFLPHGDNLKKIARGA